MKNLTLIFLFLISLVEGHSQTNLPILKIGVGKNEIKASSQLRENHLIYAIKIKNKSIVFKRNLQLGVQTKIFEFEEKEIANKSGNFGEYLSPNVALSPEKDRIAFIDHEGLKLYQIPSGKVIELKKANNLSQPLWSADGKYLSFSEQGSENRYYSFIELATGEYLSLGLTGHNLIWSRSGHAFAQLFYPYDGPSGLHIFSGDFAKITDISKKFGKENAFFEEADFSPDTQKLVFIYFDQADENNSQNIAIVDSNGESFTILKKGLTAQSLLFTPQGNEVFFVQKEGENFLLKKCNLKTRDLRRVAILPKGFTHWQSSWTQEGLLSLIGISRSDQLIPAGDETIFFILDVVRSKLIYASPAFKEFVTFAGLVK